MASLCLIATAYSLHLCTVAAPSPFLALTTRLLEQDHDEGVGGTC
jgi:hypothetical protein